MGNYKTEHLKLRIYILLTIFLPTISFGQNLHDSLLATFYNKTLTYYFSDTSTFKDQMKFGCILLKTDFDTTKLIKNAGTNMFKYFDSKTIEQKVLDKPLKKNKERNIYWINHKSFGKDTVDINIGGWTVEKVNGKKLFLSAWCGGTMGYIPDGRFVYSKTQELWTFTTGKEIVDELWKTIKKK